VRAPSGLIRRGSCFQPEPGAGWCWERGPGRGEENPGSSEVNTVVVVVQLAAAVGEQAVVVVQGAAGGAQAQGART